MSQIMAEVSGADFEATMLHALQCIGCSYLTPKPEQLASVRMYMKVVMFSCSYLLDTESLCTIKFYHSFLTISTVVLTA